MTSRFVPEERHRRSPTLRSLARADEVEAWRARLARALFAPSRSAQVTSLGSLAPTPRNATKFRGPCNEVPQTCGFPWFGPPSRSLHGRREHSRLWTITGKCFVTSATRTHFE